MKNAWLTVVFIGCATTPTTATSTGPVVTRVDREERLCLDHGALQAGQQVRLKRQVCGYVPPKNLVRVCHEEVVERAEVVRVVDQHCAEVALPAGEHVEPGDAVEIASSN